MAKNNNTSDLDPQRVGNFFSSFFVSSNTSGSSSPIASMPYENPIETNDKPLGSSRGRKSGRGRKKVMAPPPTPAESFQDEEFGGTRLNETVEDDVVSNSSWFEKHKRCWIGLGIVLIALVASIASATATAIGMALGLSNNNNNNNNANTAPPAAGIAAPNTEGGAPRCPTVRCGLSWADANSKCGTRCGASWLESIRDSNGSTASSCPAGESCFSDLNPVLDCCLDYQDEGPDSTADSEDPTQDEEHEISPDISSTPDGPQCAKVRCGTSWIDANSKCGAQCLTQACPNGEACWADLDPSLECCSESLDSQKPLFNVRPEDSVCSAMRCGISWQDANSKCGDSCQVPEEDACPSGETCYQGLDTNNAWCSSTSRCGSSWNEANGKCGQSCSIPTCPTGESCYADVSTSTLECCFPDPEPMECTTTRCGVTWANANNYCLPNCESDADCTGDLQRCYADLTTNLDCCLDAANDERTSANIMDDEPDATCTTTRCGLSWGSANTNCGTNCVDNGDCSEQGHTCFADLTTDLDCCGTA